MEKTIITIIICKLYWIFIITPNTTDVYSYGVIGTFIDWFQPAKWLMLQHF